VLQAPGGEEQRMKPGDLVELSPARWTPFPELNGRADRQEYKFGTVIEVRRVERARGSVMRHGFSHPSYGVVDVLWSNGTLQCEMYNDIKLIDFDIAAVKENEE
jgi:hypothetical protein